jgi:coenzyme F420-0:L-glutamate ligase / coenzyme F420-1:gamma-L-glutamate ligase
VVVLGMPETIAIIGGTGAMGRGLGYRWARAGHAIIIASRDKVRARTAARRLLERVPEGNIRGEAIDVAAAAASVVVLTVPYANRAPLLTQLSKFLQGKLLVDTTVPLQVPTITRVALPAAGAAALETRAQVGQHVDVVAAFHNIAAHLLDSDADIDCDVLVAGDNIQGRERVIELAAAARLRAWHAGPLANAAAPEALTSVLLQINKQYGLRASGIRIVSASQPMSAGTPPDQLQLTALVGIPRINSGDDLSQIIWSSLATNGIELARGDVLVVTQKIVSKAEGRMVRLDSVRPSDQAVQLATETGKDARLIQLMLDDSTEIVAKKRGVIIVEHRSGTILANAGIDQSNVPEGYALMLPMDPDKSASKLREDLHAYSGNRVAVIISDSIGRAWRNGTVGQVLGVAGLDPLVDLRGRPDMFGRPLRSTQVAVAESIAAAATLMMGEADEMKPVVLVRGYAAISEHVGVEPLLRERQEDLFR